MLKKTTEKYFAMAAYTFAIAQRTNDPMTRAMTGDRWRPFELDQRHNLQLAVSRRWPKWRLGARLQVVTGAPYSPTISLDEFGDQGEVDPFGGRLPTFVSLDVRADRRWHRCWGDINLFFDIQNAIFYPNVEGREFSYDAMGDEDIPGIPILPFIGVEFLPLL